MYIGPCVGVVFYNLFSEHCELLNTHGKICYFIPEFLGSNDQLVGLPFSVNRWQIQTPMTSMLLSRGSDKARTQYYPETILKKTPGSEVSSDAR